MSCHVMSWLGAVALAMVIAGGLVLVVVGIKGVKAIRTDGWSPAEAVIGRKLSSKNRDIGAK
jgi:hypothetical protein